MNAAPASTFRDLAGKVAVVVGGSKGIGAATCGLLAANGAKVAVLARSAADIDAVVADLRQAGSTALGCSVDVLDPNALDRGRQEIEQELGPVDLAAAFAGGFLRVAPFWELSEAEWREVVDANLTSSFLTLRAFAPRMIERRRGAFVLMGSSVSRVIDRPLNAGYAAAKAGAQMLARHAAAELGPHGIRVNAIAPATVLSERVVGMTNDSVRARIAELSPLGTIGTPEDCAAAAVFLLSDAAGWITGATLDVAGGRVMI
jgi:3-oxoacyl-[acyl-carrier protein] reductase